MTSLSTSHFGLDGQKKSLGDKWAGLDIPLSTPPGGVVLERAGNVATKTSDTRRCLVFLYKILSLSNSGSGYQLVSYFSLAWLFCSTLEASNSHCASISTN